MSTLNLLRHDGLVSRLGSKVWPVRSAFQFMRWFRNWREVLSAYRHKRPIPTLVLRNGMTIEHDAADDPLLIFREVFVGHCYAGDDFYIPHAQDTVVDIGANIGLTSLYLSWRAPGIRVHSFEPAAATRAKLLRNLSINRLDRVTVHAEAVSDRSGVAQLFSGPHSGHGSLYAHDLVGAASPEPTRLITLSEALDMTGAAEIDLLKIDAEGSEVDILAAHPEQDLARVKRVAVEYHEAVRPGALASVQASLSRGGLTKQVVEPGAMNGQIGLVRATR
jgi:31-O-methyltransferase